MTPGSSNTWFRYCGSCDVWVEAQKCATNTSPWRVFVREDDLPGSTSVFEFASQGDHRNCWIIDPDGAKVCLPKNVLIATGPFPYDNCSDCESDDPGNGGSGGGGSGGGSGGGGGGFGGGGGGGSGGGNSSGGGGSSV